MHDLYLAKQISDLVISYTKKYKLKKITKIRIELGRLVEHGEEISPKNLRYFLKLLTKGTKAAQAKIEIKKIRGCYWRIKEIVGK
ncbi:MAG: hydrogenase/urease maturation nickel metallochaperone HypA [Patescibacteria group bacterium]